MCTLDVESMPTTSNVIAFHCTNWLLIGTLPLRTVCFQLELQPVVIKCRLIFLLKGIYIYGSCENMKKLVQMSIIRCTNWTLNCEMLF